MAKFRGTVGTRRISGTLNPAQASYTRAIRQQMKAIENSVTDFINTVRNVTPRVLDKALRPTFDKSQVRVPKDTGELKASGFLEVKKKGKVVQADMGYGLAGKPFYAVYVHERTDVAHAAPTTAKFLQAPIQEDLPKLNARLKKAYKEEVGIR